MPLTPMNPVGLLSGLQSARQVQRVQSHDNCVEERGMPGCIWVIGGKAQRILRAALWKAPASCRPIANNPVRDMTFQQLRACLPALDDAESADSRRPCGDLARISSRVVVKEFRIVRHLLGCRHRLRCPSQPGR
jgi:hypothetical protein